MTRHVTLVALYGEKKSPEFAALVAMCQQIAGDVLRSAFKPYAMGQVHATIVGMERHEDTGYRNGAFADLRGRDEAMNLGGYIDHLRASEHVPFRIQIGGFGEGETPFLSQGRTPHERSVSARGETIVLVGWPVPRESGRQRPLARMPVYPHSLDAIRREAQRFGILHRYHSSPSDTDNDFFFRIGLVDPDAAPEASMALAESRIRTALSQHAPVQVEVGLDELGVAAYTDTTLPQDSTEHWPLSDPRVDGAFVSALYV